MAVSHLIRLLSLLFIAQTTEACCYYYGCYCVYSLWYFWFGLFWCIVFLILLIIGCIKKHKRARAQVGTVAVISNGTVAQNTQLRGHQPKPIAPPSYAQASQRPPPYAGPPPGVANPPGVGMYPAQAGYPPPHPSYPPAPPSYNLATAPGTTYSTSNAPNPPMNDPAYPPVS